jgi:23S rRNA (uridine2552-2'-O)-methyltransferase
MICDITEEDARQQIQELLPRNADTLISDASPNISGIWEVDHARQIDLAQKALYLASETLRQGGNFFVKVFQGDMLDDFVEKVKQQFRDVRVIKPDASRAKSSEVYVLATHFKPSEPGQ